MAGKQLRITLQNVKSLQRGDWINDTVVPGFKVRRPRRLALYGLNIRIGGRMRWLSLGTEADLTPDQARAEAERYRGLKRQGVDAASQRDQRKSTPSLEAACRSFLADHVSKLKRRTQAHYAEMFDRLILPAFDGRRLDAISTTDVEKWHGTLSKTPIQANRALAILSSCFSWAVERKLAQVNPCRRISPYRERAINRYPTVGDLQAIWMAAERLEARGEISPYFAAGIKVLMLTGARRSEVFEALWSWFDEPRAGLVLPDSKTGIKHISLPDTALMILRDLPRLFGSEYLFPSTREGRPFVNFGPAWAKILQEARVGSWRIHDLRHGFASVAVEQGAPLHVVGRQLGHARPNTTGRYAHIGDEAKRAAAELVTIKIGGANNGKA